MNLRLPSSRAATEVFALFLELPLTQHAVLPSGFLSPWQFSRLLVFFASLPASLFSQLHTVLEEPSSLLLKPHVPLLVLAPGVMPHPFKTVS
jgi:hypothetical protein